MEIKKDISYLGKDFNQFRKNLIEFTKQYFPTVYTDFNESDPGMLFLEMSAYVGDVLSFYADTNLKESLLSQATERGNVFDLAYSLGYTPSDVKPAYVDLSVYQLVPSKLVGTNYTADYTYALSIKPGMLVKDTNSSAVFRTLESVDFSLTVESDVVVYEVNPATNTPTYFLLKRKVRAVSGQIKTTTFTFQEAIPYDKITLPDNGIMEIVSIKDSADNTWYEVPYLAQDTIFYDVPNVSQVDPTTSAYQASSPYLLKMKYVPKRFVTRRRSDGLLELQFGSGVSNSNDVELIPNPINVGNGLVDVRRSADIDIDPANFLYTNVYGQAPANTTLTVSYTVGSGLSDNVLSDTLTKIDLVEYFDNINFPGNVGTLNFIKNTVSVTNEVPAIGAKSAESLQNIKLNALANFSTQLRAVTLEDYIIRSYAMPAKYGGIAKAYIIPDDQITQRQKEANPLALNMYILCYNASKQLVTANVAIKENLKTYLNHYRILTDAINIKDAYVINIGIDYKISVLPNFNSNEVLLKCTSQLKEYFDIDRWQINQPILESDVFTVIANVKGVQSVRELAIKNLYDADLGYSGNNYDLKTATKSGVIYPALDPSIFEIKYPNQDIRGSVQN